MTDNTERGRLVSQLVAVASELPAGELSVLVEAAQFMARGLREYGSFDPLTERRDMLHEIREEALDMLMYRAMRYLVATRTEG